MSATNLNPPRDPAAYCDSCSTVFNYEERDLFLSELFCPRCTSRTDASARARTLAQIRKLFPAAKVYTPTAPLAQLRPHARGLS